MRVTVTPEQIQTAFEAVKDDPSFDESRGLWERGHAAGRDDPGDVPATGDPARLRGLREQRLSRAGCSSGGSRSW